MKIDFYYVEGLNEIDTLYFENQQQQENYFEDKKVVSYDDDAYYPPHSSVELQVSSEDVNLNRAINYVSLYYNDKYYYYFIASINYENENLWKVSLDIDSIQTYMFNITNVLGTVERMSIDRWSLDKINRNYERENLSESEFVNHSYKELKYEGDIKIELYKSSLYGLSTRIYRNGACARTPFSIMVRFVNFDGSYFDKITYRGDIVTNVNEIPINNDYVYIGTYWRSLKEFGLSFTITNPAPTIYNLDIDYNPDTDAMAFYYGGDHQDKHSFFISYLNLDYFIPTISSDPIFVKNTHIASPKSYRYTPFLLDNQYIKIYYGERANLKEIPLFLYDTDVFNIKIYNDIISNVRNYCVGDIDNDKNLTLLSCDSPLQIELFSKPWNDFVSRNQATLASGKFVVDPLAKGIASSAVGGPFVGVAVGAGALVNNLIKFSNLKSSPADLKSSGTYSTDVLMNSVTPIIKTDFVKDIQKVSETIEMIGYKVNEPVSTRNLFDSMNIRYYFNVIKMSDCSISLNILQDAETLKNIENRLKNGVRLWNATNISTIGRYDVDNVEKQYIED